MPSASSARALGLRPRGQLADDGVLLRLQVAEHSVLVVALDSVGQVSARDHLRLVLRIGAGHVLGVVDGGLRVLEQRLARVGVVEGVDAVLLRARAGSG